MNNTILILCCVEVRRKLFPYHTLLTDCWHSNKIYSILVQAHLTPEYTNMTS